MYLSVGGFFGGKEMSNIQVTSQDTQLLDAKSLGSRLRLSKRQIFRLNSAGKIPAPIRIGGSVRWSEGTIAAWLRAGAPDRRIFEAMQEVEK